MRGFAESAQRAERLHAMEAHVTKAKAEILDLMTLATTLAHERNLPEHLVQKLLFAEWKQNAASMIGELRFAFETQVAGAVPSGMTATLRHAVLAQMDTLRAGRLPEWVPDQTERRSGVREATQVSVTTRNVCQWCDRPHERWHQCQEVKK